MYSIAINIPRTIPNEAILVITEGSRDSLSPKSWVEPKRKVITVIKTPRYSNDSFLKESKREAIALISLSRFSRRLLVSRYCLRSRNSRSLSLSFPGDMGREKVEAIKRLSLVQHSFFGNKKGEKRFLIHN